MKKASLSFKISFSFIAVSVVTLAFFYVVFTHMFERYMVKVEKEKAVLIAQTIEPLIAMNYFLGLDHGIKSVAEKTAEHRQIEGLSIEIEGKDVWSRKAPGSSDLYISVSYPVISPVDASEIGVIKIAYARESLNRAINQIHDEILKYLSVLTLVFAVYVFVTRYLFLPFAQIAKKVKNYVPGSSIDFSMLREEVEVKAITSAFESMVSNIREYTVLLERYKHSVDESAIVVRMDLEGRITYVNDEFCRLSGYTLDEALGTSIFVICHSDAGDEQCEDIFKSVRANNIWKGNIQNRRKNGSIYYVRVTIVPILDEQENILELISIQQDITQVVEQQEKIIRQTMDPITGLYNRIKLEEDVVQIKKPEFAIVSLDNYNVIKDYYGWESGRTILKEVAEIFLKVAADNDLTAYKLTGSNFSLLGKNEIGMESFHEICRDLLMEINNYTIELDEGAVNIGASAGLTTDKEHLLSYAGLALKHAQETRNLTIVYEETGNLVQHFENNLFWTKKLSFALKENRIALFVQPIVDSKSMNVDKYECLVRMTDEDGEGVIPPSLFLNIAKESKLYHQITEQVITIAFDVFSRVPDVGFSINLTLDDLLHTPTVSFLRSKLDESGLADRLMIEIVESEGIENFQEVREFVADMKGRGCKIAIDDFGSGYSNFAYLMELNVDCIKIDGSLIKTMDQDKNSKIITSTILDFSRQLEITTVAEFVHNQAVLDSARNMGIDYVQGFYLGEPEPIESLVI